MGFWPLYISFWPFLPDARARVTSVFDIYSVVFGKNYTSVFDHDHLYRRFWQMLYISFWATIRILYKLSVFYSCPLFLRFWPSYTRFWHTLYIDFWPCIHPFLTDIYIRVWAVDRCFWTLYSSVFDHHTPVFDRSIESKLACARSRIRTPDLTSVN